MANRRHSKKELKDYLCRQCYHSHKQHSDDSFVGCRGDGAADCRCRVCKCKDCHDSGKLLFTDNPKRGKRPGPGRPRIYPEGVGFADAQHKRLVYKIMQAGCAAYLDQLCKNGKRKGAKSLVAKWAKKIERRLKSADLCELRKLYVKAFGKEAI